MKFSVILSLCLAITIYFMNGVTPLPQNGTQYAPFVQCICPNKSTCEGTESCTCKSGGQCAAENCEDTIKPPINDTNKVPVQTIKDPVSICDCPTDSHCYGQNCHCHPKTKICEAWNDCEGPICKPGEPAEKECTCGKATCKKGEICDKGVCLKEVKGVFVQCSCPDKTSCVGTKSCTCKANGQCVAESCDDTTTPPINGTTEAPIDDTTKAPTTWTTEAPIDDTTKAPTTWTTEAPIDDTTKAPTTTKAPIDDTTKAYPYYSTKRKEEKKSIGYIPVVCDCSDDSHCSGQNCRCHPKTKICEAWNDCDGEGEGEGCGNTTCKDLPCPASKTNLQGGQDKKTLKNITSAEECFSKCKERATCNYWSWVEPNKSQFDLFCVMVSQYESTNTDQFVISGAKTCDPTQTPATKKP